MALEPAAAGYDLVRDEYYFWVVWLITILEFFFVQFENRKIYYRLSKKCNSLAYISTIYILRTKDKVVPMH